MGIKVTDAAAVRAKSFLDSRGSGLGLRLGVKNAGCSDLAYELEFVEGLNRGDEMVGDNGVNIIIDGKSLA